MASNLINVFSDNATTTLAAGIAPSSTSLQVNTGGGALFPAIGSGGEQFIFTIVKAGNANIFEICVCLTRSGDQFTSILRAQEGTTALTWAAGDLVNMFVTAGGLNLLVQPAQAQAQEYNFSLDSGIANAYIVEPNPPLTVRTRGMPLRFLATHSNTGASTIVDGLGGPVNPPIVTQNGQPLTAGDIVAGNIQEVAWNGSSAYCLLGVQRLSFSQLLAQIAASQVPQAAVTQYQAALVLAWSQITSGKPTTVAGYGITDALTQANFPCFANPNGVMEFPVAPGVHLYLQWGECFPNNGFVSVTFPVAFPNSVYVAVTTSTAAPSQSNVTALSNSGMTVFNTGGHSYYIAIGT